MVEIHHIFCDSYKLYYCRPSELAFNMNSEPAFAQGTGGVYTVPSSLSNMVVFSIDVEISKINH